MDLARDPDWSPCRVESREVRRARRWLVHIGLLGFVLTYAGAFGVLSEGRYGGLATSVGAVLAALWLLNEAVYRSASGAPTRRLKAMARERGMSRDLWVSVRYLRDGWEYGRDEGVLSDVGPHLAFEGWRTSFAVPLTSIESRVDKKRRAAGEYRVGVLGTGIEILFVAPTHMLELVAILESQSREPATIRDVPPPLTPRPRSLSYLLRRGSEAAPKWIVILALILLSYVLSRWEIWASLNIYVSLFLANLGSFLLGVAIVLLRDRRQLRKWNPVPEVFVPQLGGS